MPPEDVIKYYGKHLSQYEKDELMDFETIYYININSKLKGIG